MSTTAPNYRAVEALSGDIAPSPVLGILATADHIHEAIQQAALAQADADDAAETIGLLLDERDELKVELAEEKQRGEDLFQECAALRRKVQVLESERDTWRMRAQCGGVR